MFDVCNKGAIILFKTPIMLLQLLILFSVAASAVQHQPATRAEAEHVGAKYTEPPIVHEFKQSQIYLDSPSRHHNEFMLHHRLVEEFCTSRAEGKCSWWEYYRILDDVLRKEYSKMFDPGLVGSFGQPLRDILEDNVNSCLVLQQEPTADEFLQYVMSSRPVIIPATNKIESSEKLWSLKNLENTLGDQPIVVSAAPSSEFDGPENISLWGVSREEIMNRTKTTDGLDIPHLIVRPAHLQMTFREYAHLLKSKKINSANFYLEYFPMSALIGDLSGSSMSKGSVTRKRKAMMRTLPEHSFSNFLARRFNLLWLSGGKGRKNLISKNNFSVSTANTSPNMHGHYPTSRMHFDRMENLMTVITGTKTFLLYPPSESGHLYAGTPCISASLSANVTRQANHDEGHKVGSVYIKNITFYRNKNHIKYDVNRHHTYAPVNVKHPDYKKFPSLRQARGFECQVKAGETLYLPAHWWHEVTSSPDKEGKCIGVNSFFEPMYLRTHHNTSLNFFQTNRYYGHLHLSHRAVACNDDHVCFSDVSNSGIKSSIPGDGEKLCDRESQCGEEEHCKTHPRDVPKSDPGVRKGNWKLVKVERRTTDGKKQKIWLR